LTEQLIRQYKVVGVLVVYITRLSLSIYSATLLSFAIDSIAASSWKICCPDLSLYR